MNKDIYNRILTATQELKDELTTLISETVRIPSINPTYGGIPESETKDGESNVNRYLQPVMAEMSLETDLWEEEKGRANLVGVCKGSGQGKSLIFNGHVDVVPPGPEETWKVAGPWSGRVLNGRVYGRGAADMKAGNAAAIIGLKAVLKAGLRPLGDVILENVVGEEMMNTAAGTGATIKRGYRADAAIVVEPSAPPYPLALATASPGVMILHLEVEGKAAHTCMRDELIRAGGAGSRVAVSALEKALVVYHGLLKLEEQWGQTKSHPAFSRPGHFTICPVTFMSGLRGIGYIPDLCVLEYVVWHAPQDSPETVKAEIEEQIERFAQTDPWLRDHPPSIEWTFWWPPYDLNPDSPICHAVASAHEAALGFPLKAYGFAAVNDATFFNQAGIPAVTVGPGSLEHAHGPDEYVIIDDALNAAKLYALTIAEWCGV